MEKKRCSHGCALFQNNLEIVVAGGVSAGWALTNTMEIYNIASDEWRTGTPLPPDMNMGWSYVSHENTLWIIGAGEDMVYRYSENEEQWDHMNGIKTSGILPHSTVLLEVDDTLKCR